MALSPSSLVKIVHHRRHRVSHLGSSETGMTKIIIKYVNEYIDRQGRLRRYFRKGSQRGPLPGAVGSAEFMRAYEGYLSGNSNTTAPKTITTLDGSFGRLITSY